MSATHHRARARKLRQRQRELLANTQFDTKHVSVQAGKEWIRHGGNIETYKKAWPVRQFNPQGNFFDKLRAI